MTTPDQPRSIPVHVTSANEGVFRPAPPRRALVKTSTRTVVIDAQNPYPVALARDESREFAIITALDAAVVLSDSWAEVQDPANLVTGLLNPSGSVLPVGIAYPVLGFNAMWFSTAAASYPARVSLIIGHGLDSAARLLLGLP